MAICRRCGRKFDPEEAQIDFENDPLVIKHDLAYTYEGVKDFCAECALDDVYENLPQGLEDMSYRLYDD